MGSQEVEKNAVNTGKPRALTASQGIELQREALQTEKGFTLADSVKRLQKIASGKLKQRVKGEDGKYKVVPVPVPVSAMVAAENSIESKMGWKAAEKVEITQRSLLMSFNDMSPEDLKALEGVTAECL